MRTQLDESVARYLDQLDTADRQEPSDGLALKTTRLKEKLAKLESEMRRLEADEKLMLASPDQPISLTDPDSRSMATGGRGTRPRPRAVMSPIRRDFRPGSKANLGALSS